MRFGEETSPRVYTWGNIGAPRTSVDNVVMAAGRITEGGTFQRNYVPMHDASTTDPVVRQVSWVDGQVNLESWQHEQYKSVCLVTNGNAAVVAIDHQGRMWTWGNDRSVVEFATRFDPTGLGGPDARIQPQRHLMHRPVRVLMPSERDGTTVAWSKVQSRISQSSVVALSQDGRLYASGTVVSSYDIDKLGLTNAITFTPHFVPLSTQTWRDFGLVGQTLYAIRQDGTLHTKNSSLLSPGNGNQVKGWLVDATFDTNRFAPYETNASLSYEIFDPLTQRDQSYIVRVVKNTSTRELYPYVDNLRAGYTSTPTAKTFTRNWPSGWPVPTLTLRLASDTSWTKIESQGTKLVLFNDLEPRVAGAEPQKDVLMLLPLPTDLPDGGIYKTFRSDTYFGGVFNVRKPYRNDLQVNRAVGQALSCAISVDSSGQSSTVANSYALRVGGGFLPPGSKSNVICWGGNESGCLAIGNTSPQDTLTVAPSPDTNFFAATALSLGKNYSLAIRREQVLPGLPGLRQAHSLHCAGKHDFAGNSAATASITTFTLCGPDSVTKSNYFWNYVHAFSYGDEQFSIASRTKNSPIY